MELWILLGVKLNRGCSCNNRTGINGLRFRNELEEKLLADQVHDGPRMTYKVQLDDFILDL